MANVTTPGSQILMLKSWHYILVMLSHDPGDPWRSPSGSTTNKYFGQGVHHSERDYLTKLVFPYTLLPLER